MKEKTYKQRKREKLEQARLLALQYGWKPSPVAEPPKRAKTFRVKSKRPQTPNLVAEDNFLTTFEWRKVRMEAFKKYGPKCMCCGATPADGAVMNVDHIKPRKLWPSLALDVKNLQILCHDCNHGKGNWDTTDWRPKATHS
jgi:5-methylcytosine-specific restriction endonuclease McrA